ncbi:MAG: hypothetical protein VXB01_17340, partial [Opitutae bacterium]
QSYDVSGIYWELLMRVGIGFAVLILLVPMNASAAWGVNSKSVSKWSDEKLCDALGKYEAKEDWKAVSVISKEVMGRPDLNNGACNQLAAENVDKAAERTRKRSVGAIREIDAQKLNDAIRATYEKYGESLFLEAKNAFCESRGFDPELVKAARDYTVLVYNQSKGSNAYSHIAYNSIHNQIVGFSNGISVAIASERAICTADYDEQYEKSARSYVQWLAGLRFTSQEIDQDFKVGSKRETIEEAIGEPIFSEQLGPIMAAHYCSTKQSRDDYLALYYFNDALLTSSRYEQAELEGDCKDHVKTGSYALPVAVSALIDQ